MLTAALTLVVLLAGLAAGHASRLDGAATRWVCAGTTSCALIVVVETVLGAAGWLTKPALVAAAAAVALVMLALVAVAFRLRFADLWRAELDALREALRVLRHPEIATLAAIGVVAWTWVAAAASLLPPRSVDDLGHHLPPIFEAVVREGSPCRPSTCSRGSRTR